MKKKYFYITLLLFFLFTLGAAAQEKKGETIDGLTIYPNPVSTGRIYITSKSSLNKEVEIYDVLGKKILAATISAKELNISALTPGVYIIKVKEGEATATRKLIVK
ncbi:secretion protein [Flavobacterium cyanobacteriorum]|uniref:Secretion protein n=1 Tax=Flavobacterium cyanobacteriorum TaxID=2022802 RepID=A0A255Z8H1_9FLAO|nr:T9SS type A sorting domain-containing protein [Flavobacterium cyanobacteriorum]OYQ37853.1 secretion protein [Flavobacterium cyanobacteriorum]